MKDAVLTGKSFSRSGEDSTPMLNTQYGGQWGFSTVVGSIDKDGLTKAEWISSQAYVPRDIIPLLIQYPKFMDLMPEPELWKNNFKAMIEVHAETIDGINLQVTVETEDNILGGSGSVIMDEPTGTKIERSNVSYTWTERMGRPFQRLLDAYIKFGILDPYTQVSMIGQVSKEAREYFRNNLLTADFYTASILYIEPCATMSHVVKSALHLGAFPKTSGENTMKSDRANAKAINKLTVEMAGFVISTDAVSKFAQKQLDQLAVRDSTPLATNPFTESDASLKDSPYGFNRGLDAQN